LKHYLPAFDNPMPRSLQYANGGGATSYFPVSALTDRLDACNQFRGWMSSKISGIRVSAVKLTMP